MITLIIKMRLIRQDKQIIIRNADSEEEKMHKTRHSTLLPNSIRALIVGPSNCGKTNVMLSLIESPNGICLKTYTYIQSRYINQNIAILKN